VADTAELARSLAARADGVVDLTEALVRAQSPNPPGDERAPAAVLDRYLEGVPGVSRSLVAARDERPNLIFAAGDGPRTLTLAAHMDTHPIVGDWAFDPAGQRVGDRLYGRGTTDNKGAVASMASVFRRACEQGMPAGLRLILLANADEEVGGAEGVQTVLDTFGEPLGAVVVAEPSGVDTPFEALYVAARGTSRFSLSTTGLRTHSSLAGRPGVPSAIERLEQALRSIAERVPVLSRTHDRFGQAGRLTVARIEGGDGYGVVPYTAHAELELRLTPGSTQDAIEQDIRTAVEGLDLELAFAPGSLRWMGPSEIDNDHPLTRAAISAWSDVLGNTPELGCFPGGTDARIFTERGIPALSGVGPGALVRAHHPDEYVTTGELATATRLYAAIVARYALDEGDGR
jgi:acetylornithine deacetylase/succinyl-diaminopimelate desuccinylase-like protein